MSPVGALVFQGVAALCCCEDKVRALPRERPLP